MEIQTFKELQQNSATISASTTDQLEEIVAAYPYFQSAQALLLKGFKQNNNYKYNKALKNTAAVTIDRNVLFDYINSFEKTENRATLNTDTPKEPNSLENMEIGAPLEFGTNEVHSFNQWLQLTSLKPVSRKVNKSNSLFKNEDLINSFIDNNPTIKPISKDSQNPPLPESIYQETELMTETLAKVYLEQKKYNNAIKAYEILILKYPEKSGFFADQIKKIEHLKNKKP